MSPAATQANLTTENSAEATKIAPDAATHAILALYLGETYAELEIRTTDSLRDPKTKPLFKKNYFLPQSSLKTTLNQVQKHISDLNIQPNLHVTDAYVVCRYLERLKTFRLGGSVVQIVHRGFENSYVIENTSRVSLAAAALVISVDQDVSSEFLTSELAKIRKINPDANKVAIELDSTLMPPSDIQKIKDFFTEQNFKIFECTQPQDLLQVRKTLLNAGSEGTKEEIVSEIKENFKYQDGETRVHFWVKEQFQSTDSNNFENFDLYFSSQDYLTHLLKLSKKQNLVHLDLENWCIVGANKKTIWDSPWGLVSRTYNTVTSIALHPLTEILIDETSRLQFSKLPASSEPGPMIAGRGVKSLLIDLFWDHIHNDKYFKTLFPQLENTLLQTKIESQFKVLEKGQRSESQELTKGDLIKFVLELVDFELELKLGHPASDQDKALWTGHLSKLVNLKSNPFSWTESIFQQLGGL